MGKAPAFIADDLQNGFPSGYSLKSKECETIITIGDKRYVIGASNDDTAQSIGVLIIEATGDRVFPVVLGTKPKPCKGFSAVTVNEDRILVVKKGSAPDDSVWFLEVDTQYVKEQKKRRGKEVVAWSKGVVGDAEKPIVITGPSGVGKGTLISMLMEEFPSVFGFSVSHTTRAPRNKEEDGVHYHFTEQSAMKQDIENGKFLEHASVHGNLYGTSIEAVEVVADSGKRCILDIDVQGARSVKASSLEAIFIFICPPSMKELEKRLRGRGTETEEQILKRFKNAKEEIEKGQSSGIFNHILTNDNLKECYESLKKLLGLDGNAVNTQKSSPQGIEIAEDHSVSKNDNNKKIIIKCGAPELEKASKNLIVLDVSSLKGGAPFRTRGLDVYTVDSFSDGFKGINHLN